MHVDKFSDSEMIVKSDFHIQDSPYGSNFFNLDTSEVYVSEEEINDNGEKVVTIYKVFETYFYVQGILLRRHVEYEWLL
ncbi:hypothetical protein [Paraliobacillus sp. JSM ZJ581]|uniref:hypothetical protein n=1 Tax=Paraliobacillus sp. JSM ZJ581 TaxID=3342118 RepID=UPI0035A84AC8